MRPGLGMAGVLGARGSATLLRQAPRLAALGGAFGPMARRHLRDPFLLHWVEMLCFLISGLPMDQTSAAAMAMKAMIDRARRPYRFSRNSGSVEIRLRK